MAKRTRPNKYMDNKKMNEKDEFYKFEAICITSFFDEDSDCWTVAFANDNTPSPEKYLILQRAVDDDDLYYYEVCSREYSGNGGFKKVTVTNKDLEIIFSEELINKFECKGLLIKFTKDAQFFSEAIQSLNHIFIKSDCNLATKLSS